MIGVQHSKTDLSDVGEGEHVKEKQKERKRRMGWEDEIGTGEGKTGKRGIKREKC